IAGVRAVDPGTADADAGRYGFKADGTPRGKPGRKPGPNSKRTGTGPGKSKAQSNQGVNGLEKLLYSLHMMAAAATKTPELELDKQESAMLASAISDVQSHYNFDVSEEVTIWVNLITALGAIYGPRVVVIYGRKQK